MNMLINIGAFGILAILWLGFAAALVFNPAILDTVWQTLRGLPIFFQAVVGLLVLPVAAGLWIWEFILAYVDTLAPCPWSGNRDHLHLLSQALIRKGKYNAAISILTVHLAACACDCHLHWAVFVACCHIPACRGQEPIGSYRTNPQRDLQQSRRWMYAALLIFFITGIYLMFMDPNYLGVGNFGNFWSIMMLVKHILILVMIGAGFWFNAILRVGPMLSSRNGGEQAYGRFKRYVNIMAISGVLVLLLTAFAQIQ